MISDRLPKVRTDSRVSVEAILAGIATCRWTGCSGAEWIVYVAR
jgi:hypothetical protein